MTNLPAGVHPDRMAACFRAGGSTGFAERLIGEPRFAGRLAALLARHYDLADISGHESGRADVALAGLDLKELERLEPRAGVICRASLFVQEIRGPVLAAFGERFGIEALEDARAHQDLAGEYLAAPDLDALETAVREDGRACLAAWITVLPEQLARRVKLKWADEAAVPVTSDPDILARGPEILRRLASSVGRAS